MLSIERFLVALVPHQVSGQYLELPRNAVVLVAARFQELEHFRVHLDCDASFCHLRLILRLSRVRGISSKKPRQ
jgi:hypothetical protein